MDPINVARANAEKLSENNLKILCARLSAYFASQDSVMTGRCLPLIVLGFALAFEAVYLVHIICLVVSSVQEEVLGPQPLVGVE